MRALRSLRASIPLIAQLGFSVLAAGVAADIAYHVSAAAQSAASSTGLVAHLVTLLGMVLVLIGLIGSAAKTVRRGRTKGGNDAARRSTAAAR